MDAERLEKLTERQRECLRMVLNHYSSKEMARELGIGVDAVDQRLKGAMRKLGVQSRLEAARMLAAHETVDQTREPMQRAKPSHPKSGHTQLMLRAILSGGRALLPPRSRGYFLVMACFACVFISYAAYRNISFVTTPYSIYRNIDFLIQGWAVRPRAKAASGDIVLIAIDERAVKTFGPTPWPRRRMADIVLKVAKLGPRRIFLDIFFEDRTNKMDDAALAGAFKQVRQRLLLPVYIVVDPVTYQVSDHLPLPEFRSNAELVHVNCTYQTVPASLSVGGHRFLAAAVALGGLGGWPTGFEFPVDLSIDPASVPSISVMDLIGDTVDRGRIVGRDVVIGYTFSTNGDFYPAPRYGKLPAVYTLILGAETLKGGAPVVITTPVVLFLTLFVVAACGAVNRRAFTIPVLAGAISLCAGIPFVLVPLKIYVETGLSLILLAIVAVGLGWISLRKSFVRRPTCVVRRNLPGN